MTKQSVLNFKITSICFITQCLFLFFTHVSDGAITSDEFSAFDWHLTKAVGEKGEDNVILSPISVKLLLAMLYEGAEGNTSRQLEQALNLYRNTKASTTHKFSEILKSLEEESREYDLDIGTRLFVDLKTKLNQPYSDTLAQIFNASVEKVDFSNPDRAVKVINNWAESITKGHIKDLISEADAKDSVVLLLLNAIYFKGQWLQPFSVNNTQPGVFKLSSSKSVTGIPFMNSVQHQKFYESTELESSILQLPYMGDKFAMYIILPNRVDGLSNLLKSLTPDILKEHLANMEESQVNIMFPKFHYDFASSLRPALEMLGLTDMFSEKANLTGITADNNLMVSNVIQKAGIMVNEQGSTAYVASQVELANKFGESTIYFVADHPFIFFIQDERTKSIVFVGKVMNPGSLGVPLVSNVSAKPAIRPNFLNVNYPSNNRNESQNNTASSNITEEPLQIKVIPSVQSYGGPVKSDNEVGGYYGKDGEYIKQNFNQDRWTFFDTEILQNLCDTEGNVNWVTSPASIKSILGMVYEGSAGDTEKGLSRLLRLPLNKTRGLRMIHSIQRELHAPVKSDVQWIMANRLLVSNNLPILPEYRMAMTNLYHAKVDQAKFNSPAETARDVNNWIMNVTNGFIPTLITQESIEPDAQLILLNAVYFKGDWLYPFKKRFTQDECFYSAPGNCSRVRMMRQRSFFKYGFYKELLAHVIELPYSDTRFSMVIVLPEYEDGLADVVRDLPKCPLLSYVKEMQVAEVEISLPSFTVQYFKDLTEILSKMGGGSMFSDRADFSHMLGKNKGKVTRIIHKAKIIVNEKGTEAGGGSAAVIVPLMNTQLLQISINHPFLFFIRDQRTGFLFGGQVADPSMVS